MARREAKTPYITLALMKSEAASLYSQGMPPRWIARRFNRTTKTVQRWLARMRIQSPDLQTRELWEAGHIKDEAFAIHQKCREVELVAKRLDVRPHIARAAIYLATKERQSTEQETEQEEAK